MANRLLARRGRSVAANIRGGTGRRSIRRAIGAKVGYPLAHPLRSSPPSCALTCWAATMPDGGAWPSFRCHQPPGDPPAGGSPGVDWQSWSRCRSARFGSLAWASAATTSAAGSTSPRTRAVVDAALDAGITFFDTADIYGGDGGRGQHVRARCSRAGATGSSWRRSSAATWATGTAGPRGAPAYVRRPSSARSSGCAPTASTSSITTCPTR